MTPNILERPGLVFQGIVETTGTFAYIALICILGCMTISLVGLFYAVGMRLRAARGQREVLFFVRLHQRLLVQAAEVESMFYDVLGHLMVVTFIAPLLSTLKVCTGEVPTKRESVSAEKTPTQV